MIRIWRLVQKTQNGAHTIGFITRDHTGQYFQQLQCFRSSCKHADYIYLPVPLDVIARWIYEGLAEPVTLDLPEAV